MKRLYFKYAKLCLYILTILGLVFSCLNSGEAQGAVPGAATLVSPSGTITDITPAYTWNAESNSTWYYLWVNDSTGNRITQWYTADQAGCAGGTGQCSVIPSIELAEGNGVRWIQTWNDSGYGPWSTGIDFVLDPLLPADNGCLIIGDSIGEATHTNDACDRSLGNHRELMECMDLRLGSHDLDWSFMGGTKSWSIANRLECSSVYNRSHDGDKWKDALDRVWNPIQSRDVRNVILQLGSIDVCAEYSHDYGSLALGLLKYIGAKHFTTSPSLMLAKKRLRALVSKFFYRPDHTAFGYAEGPYNIYLAAATTFNQLRRDQPKHSMIVWAVRINRMRC